MARCEYTIDLDDEFIVELERIAGELRTTPGRAVEAIAGDLRGASFSSGMTVATADGARPVITGRTFPSR
jgi:hypothetical protein